MAKNQKIDKNRLFESFITQTLENEKMPKSVYLFCSKIGIEESVFYQYYGSLDGLRTALFEAFYINTIELIEKQEDFDKKTSKEKLLLFFFTFFEVLQLNRSYVLFVLSEASLSKKWTDLRGLRSQFKTFASELIEIDNSQKEGPFSNRSIKLYSEAAWAQLLFLMQFWIKDDSASFEKTDIAIEKSVQTVFTLFGNNAFDTVFDFGKFLWREKSHFTG